MCMHDLDGGRARIVSQPAAAGCASERRTDGRTDGRMPPRRAQAGRGAREAAEKIRSKIAGLLAHSLTPSERGGGYYDEL